MHIYMYISVCLSILFFGSFSILGYYKFLNIVPCAIPQVLVIYFICSSVYGALFGSALSLAEVLETCYFLAGPLPQEAVPCPFGFHPQLGFCSSAVPCQNWMLIVVAFFSDSCYCGNCPLFIIPYSLNIFLQRTYNE